MKRKQFCYFIQAKHSGLIKIGTTSGVCGVKAATNRLRSMQTGCPEPLDLLCVIEGDREKELHSRFASDNVQGEWFTPSQKLVRFIRTCCGLTAPPKTIQKRRGTGSANIDVRLGCDIVNWLCDRWYKTDENLNAAELIAEWHSDFAAYNKGWRVLEDYYEDYDEWIAGGGRIEDVTGDRVANIIDIASQEDCVLALGCDQQDCCIVLVLDDWCAEVHGVLKDIGCYASDIGCTTAAISVVSVLRRGGLWIGLDMVWFGFMQSCGYVWRGQFDVMKIAKRKRKGQG